MARVIESFKGDIASFRRWLNQLCEDAKGETDPRHNDGPAFHTTMAVDALFERGKFQDFVHGELAWLGDITVDRDGPWSGLEILGVFRGVRFVRAKLVEIVVMGNVV